MHRNRVIALVVLILGVSALFGQAAFSARAKDKAAGKSAQTAGVKAKSGKAAGSKTSATKASGAKAKAAKALNLTADQKTKMKAIRADVKAKTQAVNADTSLTPEAKNAKLKEIKAAAIAQIKAILTPEQQKKLEKLHGGRKGDQLKDLVAKLGLNADQKAKIKSILASSKTEIKAVRDNTTLTDDAKKTKIKAIRAAEKEKILAELTPEQRTKLDAARARKAK